MKDLTNAERRLLGHKGAEAKRSGNTMRTRLAIEVEALRRALNLAMKMLGEAVELGCGEDWADDMAERVEDLQSIIDEIERAKDGGE